MGRRVGVTAEETRGQLLDAAMRVLLARGYSGTRVSEIAEEAGVTAGSIYNHFSSKADMLIAGIAERTPDVLDEVLASEGRETVLQAFRRSGATMADPASRDLAPLMMELVVTAGRDPGVAGVVEEAFATREGRLADVIRLAQDGGEVDPGLDAEALTRFVLLVAMGAQVVGALHLKEVDEEAWVRVLDRMLDAVRPPGAPADGPGTAGSAAAVHPAPGGRP